MISSNGLYFSIVAAVSCVAPATAQIAGSFEVSGEGCPNASVIYEQFAPSTFDLAGTGIEWVRNTGDGFLLVPYGGGFLPYGFGMNLAMLDDSTSGPLSLGFTFPHPGGLGSTTTIEVSSNGYIYLEPLSIPSARCCAGTGAVLSSFLNATPSFAVLGMDHDPTTNGTVWYDVLPGVVYVTWDNVAEASGTGLGTLNTFQIQLYSNGNAVFTYAPGTTAQNQIALVGWSAGGGVDDDGSIDLSGILPFDMGTSSGPLTLSSPRGQLPTTGRTFVIDVTNVPSDAVVGALLLGAFPVQADLGLIGMAGCSLLTAADIGAVPMTLTPPLGTVSLPFPTTPGTGGLVLQSQGALIAPSVNSLGVSTSNLGTLTIGNTNPVLVLARGQDSLHGAVDQPFWRIINATTLDIVSLRMSWVAAATANTFRFDTTQTGMNDRFDGGNSTTPLCSGTYRFDTDVSTGLDYTFGATSACDGRSNTGWLGSVLGTASGQYRVLDFRFTSFQPGDTFEFDVDVDGGTGAAGGDMAGLVITATMSDSSVRTGALVRVDALNARAIL